MSIDFSTCVPVPIAIQSIEGGEKNGSIIKFFVRLGNQKAESSVSSFFDLPCYYWTSDSSLISLFQGASQTCFYQAIFDGSISLKDGVERGQVKSILFEAVPWSGDIGSSVNAVITGRPGRVKSVQTKNNATMLEGGINADSQKRGDEWDNLWINWKTLEGKAGFKGAEALSKRLEGANDIAVVTVRGRLTGDSYVPKNGDGTQVQTLSLWANSFDFHFNRKEWGGGQGQGQGQSRSNAAPAPTIAPGPVPAPALLTLPASNTPGGYDDIPF